MKPTEIIDAFRPAEGTPPRTLAAFLLWCLKGAMPVLLAAGLLSSLVGALEVVAASLLGVVIDTALTSGPTLFFRDHIWLIIGISLFFVVLRPVLAGLATGANALVIQPNVNPLVLSRLHRWTMGQAVTYFDNDFAGRIAQKQMQCSRAVTEVVSEIVNVVFFALASIIGAVFLLGAIEWRVAVVLAIWTAAYLGLMRFFLPRIRIRAKDRAGARAMVSGQVVDTITNIKTVKLFAHAEHEDRSALSAMARYRERVIHMGRLSTAFRFTLMTLAGCLPVLLIGSTLWLWSNGQASAGDIAAAGTIAIRIAQMTGWVSFALLGIYSSLGEVEDGMNTLTPPHGLTDRSGALDLARAEGRVSFENVGFAYGRRSGGVHDISLTLEPGQKCGIVGASGAGKSTLVSLLLRLYDTEVGAIRIDGHDIRDLTQESLRRQIGMVTQETAMFNRSARDNVKYGCPDATDDQMIEATRRAEAHGFICELEDFAGRTGYEAHLGERGVRLSGGQRQRVALARAILKDAPILVLDEATSALDSEVEAQIQSALDRVMVGKTVLAIAHRLSTIARMDRIIVLEQGRIVEDGTHEDLLAAGGLYARYWARQSGGFLGAEEQDDRAAE